MSIDDDRARTVLAAVLAQPGGAHTVVAQLGAVPGATFTPAEEGRLFRRGTPSRLAMGDRAFAPLDAVGTRLAVSHVVRGVALQTNELGPAEAAAALVDSLRDVLALGGPAAADAAEAALYGLAASAGLQW